MLIVGSALKGYAIEGQRRTDRDGNPNGTRKKSLNMFMSVNGISITDDVATGGDTALNSDPPCLQQRHRLDVARAAAAQLLISVSANAVAEAASGLMPIAQLMLTE